MLRQVKSSGLQKNYPLVPQHGQPKVSKLEDAIGISVDVVWLHVQVQHAIRVQEVQTLQVSCIYGKWLPEGSTSMPATAEEQLHHKLTVVPPVPSHTGYTTAPLQTTAPQLLPAAHAINM